MSGEGNGGLTTGSTSSILFFVALGIGILFAALFAFMGLRYYWRRRIHPELYNNQNLALERRRRPRRKILLLMAQQKVDERFPTMSFKEARSAASNFVSQDTESSSSSSDKVMIVEEEDISEDRKYSEDINDTIVETTDLTESPSKENTIEMKDFHQQLPSDRPASRNSFTNRLTKIIRDTRESARNSLERTRNSLDLSRPSLDRDETFVDLEAQMDQHEYNESKQDEDDHEHNHDSHDISTTTVNPDTCAICLDNLEDSNVVRLLSCGHIYHQTCIDPWLTTRRACCPLCKQDYYVASESPAALAEAAANGNNERNEDLSGSNATSSPDVTGSSARTAGLSLMINNIWGRNQPIVMVNPRNPQL